MRRRFADQRTATSTVHEEQDEMNASRKPYRLRRAGLRAALAGVVALFVAALGPIGTAQADFEFLPGTVVAKQHAPLSPPPPLIIEPNTGLLFGPLVPAWLNAPGLAPEETQAGAHPDFSTSFRVETNESTAEGTVKHFLRDAVVDTPPGFLGNAQAFPRCTLSEFYLTLTGSCPPATQVGNAVTTGALNFWVPVYNLTPGPDAPAKFGFKAGGFVAILSPGVRTDGDYGLRVSSTNLPTPIPVAGTAITLWGVPYDSVHDPYRMEADGFSLGNSISATPAPFLSSPTNCSSGTQKTTIEVRSWASGDSWLSESLPFSQPTGCDQLDFGTASAPAGVTVQPTSDQAANPTGLEVNLTVPYTNHKDLLANPTLKDAEVTLPEGMSLNAAAASGLDGCSESEIGLHSRDAADCPNSSKLGTVEVQTPLLESPMKGAIYQAEPDDNPFGSLLAIYIAVEGAGVKVKLAGEVEADPSTGRLTASFEDNPQLPFTDFELSFFGGPNAALKLPDHCGTFTTEYELTPWSGTPPVKGESSFTVDSGCDTGSFDPGMSAGTTNPVAGAFSPFVFDLSREDGEQNLAAVDLALPKGLAAKLAGVPLCPDPGAGSGDCPAASQVGTVTAAVGAGSSPLWVPQPDKEPTAVYLAGPYKGGPYSIVAKVPAQAGPFDLGTVAVRSALYVDPITAQVTVRSDGFPQILDGIPIDYRRVHVGVGRVGFMLNPTDCSPTAVLSAIRSDGGKVATPQSRFQVGSCGDLGFKPRIYTRLFGGTTRGAHPRLKAVVRMPEGDANIGRAAVTLPRSEFLEQRHIKTVCTRVQFAANACPAGSVYGRAKAWTPLLDQPLEGPVYLRSSDNKLPDLVADLHGQVNIELSGRIDSVNGGIRTTFDSVPDAPVSAFVLNMQGGKKGLLVNSRNICKGTPRGTARFRGQNGALAVLHPPAKNRRCGKAG